MSRDDAIEPNADVDIRIVTSPGFAGWLATHRVSLALTSYRTGKLFFIGLNPNGTLSVFERTFARCMGMWSDGQTIWVATLFEVWRFENMLPAGQQYNEYDRCYVPQAGYVTGDTNTHDVAVDGKGRVIFVNTWFNCLATLSDTHSFVPLWKPPFIDRLVAQDYCHVNGLAMEAGRPRYCSMFAETDEAQGWRKQRLSGGRVIDLQSDQYVVDGLSMPHSPRLYRDQVWLLNSGTGDFGYVDRNRGTFEPVAFCPGYVRGLAFHGDDAIVGTSHGREQDLFEELPLHKRLKERGERVRCGLNIINLQSGELTHWLEFEGAVNQMYDVVVLPNVTRPMAIGRITDEIHHMISIGDAAPL